MRLCHNVNYVKATTAYVTMTRTELISALASWIQCVFSKIIFISLPYFNQLDATPKVMYRHEKCVQETQSSLIHNYLFVNNAVAASF